MAIELTLEEYVELKLMLPKHADRAFATVAKERDEFFQRHRSLTDHVHGESVCAW